MAEAFHKLGPLLLHTVCLILAVALVGASLYAYDTYGRFSGLRADLELMRIRQKVMKQQAAELNQKLKTIRRVQRFMKRASAMGMRPEKWAAFDVNIQGWVSFPELEKLIEQCAPSNDVYFTPIAFVVQSPEAAAGDNDEQVHEQVQPGAGKTAVKDASSMESSGDVRLVLSGAFRIRR